jgi:RNA polymerase sigma-70 factor (ECF subfamily)
MPAHREELLRLFGQRTEAAVRLAYHLTRDREAALELSQEAFVRALESLPTLADPVAATAWFNRILVNLCRDWLRRRGVDERAMEQVRSEQEVEAARLVPRRHDARDPAFEFERREEAERARAALMGLPGEYREVLALICVEGLSPQQAAEVLGIPDGTVRWRLHEGRRMVREELCRSGFPA